MNRTSYGSLIFTFALLFSFTLQAFSTPITEAVRSNDTVALDTLLATEDAGKMVNREDESGFAPIHYAVQQNLRPILSTLVQAGADLDVEDPYGRTSLSLAAVGGDADIAGYLLRHDASADAADDAGLTALHYAVISGSEAVMDTVLARGVSVDVQTKRDQTPLMMAVLYNQPALVAKLLNLGANPNLRDVTGMGPLHHAVMTGDLTLVSALVDQFADVNLLTDTGLPDKSLEEASALHLAIANDRMDIAEALLAAGASTSIANREGDTPLMLAIQNAPGTTVSRLLAMGVSLTNPDEDASPMSLAIDRGDVMLVSSLLDAGADLNRPLPSGDFPLLAAVRAGDGDLVDVLLSRGAHPDTTADRDYPLEIALDEHQKGIAQQLLTAGANTNRLYAPRSSNAFSRGTPRTALSIVVEANSLPLTQLLLEHGADVNMQVADWSSTLLEKALKDADLPIVRLLIAEGARMTSHTDISEDAVGLAMAKGYPFLREVLKAEGFNPATTDRDGNTYLHVATDQSDDARLVKALLAVGLDVNQVNADGRTPLHDAARRSRAEMTRALLIAGADPTMLDSDSKSALDVARGGAKTVLLTY